DGETPRRPSHWRSRNLGIGLLQLNCILFALYGFNRSCCLVTLRIEAKLRIGELPFYLGQSVVDTGAYASNDAHCRVGAGGVVFDQGPKRLAQVSNWIIDLLLRHGCLLSLGNWLHCGLRPRHAASRPVRVGPCADEAPAARNRAAAMFAKKRLNCPCSSCWARGGVPYGIGSLLLPRRRRARRSSHSKLRP